MSARWEPTLYAGAPVKARCGLGQHPEARAAIVTMLETAGLSTAGAAVLDDAALAAAPEAWLLVQGNSSDDWLVYVLPAAELDPQGRDDLARLDGATFSFAEVSEMDPALWHAWTRASVSTGALTADDFAPLPDPDDEARRIDVDSLGALLERWLGATAVTGNQVRAGMLDRRFIGVTLMFEWL